METYCELFCKTAGVSFLVPAGVYRGSWNYEKTSYEKTAYELGETEIVELLVSKPRN